MNFAVYAIMGNHDRIYVGQTQDIERRVTAHNRGLVAYTKSDRPWRLIKSEQFATREEARFFEWQLKRSRGKRLKWLQSR